MKKLMLIFVGALISMSAYADDYLFGKYQNSLSISGAYGIKKDNNRYTKSSGLIQYSQPNKVFRLTGRMNVEAMYSPGEIDAYSTTAIGLSQDILLLETSNVYLGIGGGIYLRQVITPNLGSKFAFGAKAFVGHKLTDYFGIEVYVNHYSNGDLAKPNIGEEYVGASLMLYY